MSRERNVSYRPNRLSFRMEDIVAISKDFLGKKGIIYFEKGLFFFELIWCVVSLSLSHPSVRF